MTGPRHHPRGETLMSHAARTLDPALSLVLSCHFQFCGRCRTQLRAMDNVGGLLLEGLMAPEDDDFLKRTMHRFAAEVAHDLGTLPLDEALDPGSDVIMPRPLERATGLRRETIPWRKMPHGLSRFNLPKFPGASASAEIVHIEPNAILHSERHGGQLIVVLWGAYDYEGDHFERGDLHDISESGFKTFKGGAPEGATFFTAISPVPQIQLFRTGH
jgi:putative transcriptional regulator